MREEGQVHEITHTIICTYIYIKLSKVNKINKLYTICMKLFYLMFHVTLSSLGLFNMPILHQ